MLPLTGLLTRLQMLKFLDCVCACRKSDVAWAISTAVHDQPVDGAPQDKRLAAVVQPRSTVSANQTPQVPQSPSQLQLIPDHSGSLSPLLH